VNPRLATRFKKLLWIMAQALLISLITFALTEVTFRVYGYFNPTFIFHGSSFSRSYNTYRGKPHSRDYDSKLNSHGFKGREFTIRKPPNTYRILAIGDSFTFGIVPYEYNYTYHIERQLNRELSASDGVSYELVNMGISGTGPRDYLTLLVDEGLQLHPDMVIVSIFIGNDIIEAQRNDVVRDYWLKEPWYTSSYVLSFFRYLLTVSHKFEGGIQKLDHYDDNAPTHTEDAFFAIQVPRLQNFVKNDREFLDAFRVQVGYLHQIKRICDKNHIGLLFVLIPDEMQVNKAQQIEVIKRAKVDPAQVDMLQVNRMLQHDCAAEGIPYIDLLPTFAASDKSLYKPRNTHWNIAGNLLAAQNITPKVIELIHQASGALTHAAKTPAGAAPSPGSGDP